MPSPALGDVVAESLSTGSQGFMWLLELSKGFKVKTAPTGCRGSLKGFKAFVSGSRVQQIQGLRNFEMFGSWTFG